MNLLETFDGLIGSWRDVFPQTRTFQRARRLVFGRLVSVRMHLTSNAICAAGRQFVDWTADYRVCSRSPWNPHRLFDPIFDHLPQLLASPGAPVRMALDDTMCKKSSARIPGVSMGRDPMSPPFHVNLCYGLRFVQASILVTSTQADGPARALPVRFDFAPPAKKPKQNKPKKSADAISAQPQSPVPGGAASDSPPSTGPLQTSPAADPEWEKQKQEWDAKWQAYKKEHKLRRLPLAGLNAIRSVRESLNQRPETCQRILIVSGDGSYTTREVLRGVYWRKAGVDVPIQVIVIKPLAYRLRKGSKLLYRKPAFLICTDSNMDLQALVQDYVYRWEIECNHRDEKSLLGVAQGQVWNLHAVQRLPQLQVASYSLLLLASLLSSGFQRTADYLPLPKWRRQSARPSLLDLLNLLRNQIFARGVDAPVVSFDDFASAAVPPELKSSKLPLAAETLTTLAA